MVDEKREQLIKKIIENRAELEDIEADSLSRESDLGKALSFTEDALRLLEMVEIVWSLDQEDFERLPESQLAVWVKAVSKVKSLVEQVTGFTVSITDPRNRRDQLRQEIINAHNEVMQDCMLAIAYCSATEEETTAKWAELRRLSKEAFDLTNVLEGKLVEFEQKAKVVMNSLRDSAVEGSVTTHARFYDAEAEHHRASSFRWLLVVAALVITTLSCSFWFLWLALHASSDSVGNVVGIAIAKVLTLSVLSLGIVWCSRNYRAERHNMMLNRHRALALKTLKAMREGSDDPKIRDGVLLFCAQAAFGNRTTGYEDSDKLDSPMHIVNPVVELVGKANK